MNSAEEVIHEKVFSKNQLYCPSDHRFAFSLKTTKRNFIIYSKTREERDIFVHELYNICKE